MADWDPELYHRFRRYREEPVVMMLERLPLAAAERIADLGCGTGEHTVELMRRSRAGSALGIDSSAAMIDRANTLRAGLNADLRRRVRFELGDFCRMAADRGYDVIFSNAAFQWTQDHRDLLCRCFLALRRGGSLAVQMPANHGEIAQLTLQSLANEARWRPVLAGIRTPSDLNVRSPGDYSAMLREIGFSDIDCHYHVFHHPMDGPTEIVEWMRATTLRPYLDALPSERHEEFIAELTHRLEIAYGTRGRLVFDFRRLFLWAGRIAN